MVFNAFQIIQYDFIVVPAIPTYNLRYIHLMNVLCCRHLQEADPTKYAHDNLKHIVCFICFVVKIQIYAILFVSYAHVNLCHFFSSSWSRGPAAASAYGPSWSFLFSFLRRCETISNDQYCIRKYNRGYILETQGSCTSGRSRGGSGGFLKLPCPQFESKLFHFHGKLLTQFMLIDQIEPNLIRCETYIKNSESAPVHS